MRTLFIHVGPDKTGTSAIQHALLSHDGSIVVYPRIGLWEDGSHHNLVFNFFEDFTRPEVIRSSTDVLLGQFAHVLATSQQNVVISSEVLAKRRDIGRFLEALSEIPGGGSYQLEVVIVCRDHFFRAASAYNQDVRDVFVRERELPDVFLRRVSPDFGYADLVRTLLQTGIKVSLLNYHPAITLVTRFLRHIGFPNDRIPRAAIRNVSLSPKALVATLAANNVAGDAYVRQHYSNALYNLREFHAPSRFIFGREAAMHANQHFGADRMTLEAEFGIKLPGRRLWGKDVGLYVNARELAEIRAVTRELGAEGAAIADFAARFQQRRRGIWR